jgi:hypothetical protein
VPAPAVQSSATSTPRPAGDLHYAGESIFLLHVDYVVGAQFLRDLQARSVFGSAGHYDQRRTRLFANDCLRQSLLPGP